MWEEAHSREINMPEDDFEEVGTYLKFTYSKKFQTKLSSPAKEHELVVAYMEADTIYVFADKVQDTVTKNEMLARVIELARTPDETIIPEGRGIIWRSSADWSFWSMSIHRSYAR
jgi:hypothetical protein